jgi:hypothetical protein
MMKNKNDGENCENNNNCLSGLCGYNGPAVNGSTLPEFVCMQKKSKESGKLCWDNIECKSNSCEEAGEDFDFDLRCK